MVNKALPKGFRSAALYSSVKEVVQKPVPEPPSIDTVMEKLVDDPSFTVPVAKLVKHEVQRNYVDKAKMENPFARLTEAVQEKNMKTEHEIPAKNRLGSIPSPADR